MGKLTICLGGSRSTFHRELKSRGYSRWLCARVLEPKDKNRRRSIGCYWPATVTSTAVRPRPVGARVARFCADNNSYMHTIVRSRHADVAGIGIRTAHRPTITRFRSFVTNATARDLWSSHDFYEETGGMDGANDSLFSSRVAARVPGGPNRPDKSYCRPRIEIGTVGKRITWQARGTETAVPQDRNGDAP